MKQSLTLISYPSFTDCSPDSLHLVERIRGGSRRRRSAARPRHSQSLHEPDDCMFRNGSWSDPATWSIGQVPTVNDRVAVSAGTTVTYDRQSDADLSCVNVHGQLTFRADVSTRLTVGTLTVMPGAGLQIGTNGSPVAATVTAEIVISDRPVNTGTDPEQYGTGLLGFGRITMHGSVKSPTFVRLSAEASAGQSSLSLWPASPAGRGAIVSSCRARTRRRAIRLPIKGSGRRRRWRRRRARAWLWRVGSRSRTPAAATRPARCLPAPRRQHHAQRRDSIAECPGHARARAADESGRGRHPLHGVPGPRAHHDCAARFDGHELRACHTH